MREEDRGFLDASDERRELAQSMLADFAEFGGVDMAREFAESTNLVDHFKRLGDDTAPAWELEDRSVPFVLAVKEGMRQLDPESIKRVQALLALMAVNPDFAKFEKAYQAAFYRKGLSDAREDSTAVRIMALVEEVLSQNPDHERDIKLAVFEHPIAWLKTMADAHTPWQHMESDEDRGLISSIRGYMAAFLGVAERRYQMYVQFLDDVFTAAGYLQPMEGASFGNHTTRVVQKLREHHAAYADLVDEEAYRVRNAAAHNDFELDFDTLEVVLRNTRRSQVVWEKRMEPAELLLWLGRTTAMVKAGGPAQLAIQGLFCGFVLPHVDRIVEQKYRGLSERREPMLAAMRRGDLDAVLEIAARPREQV